ncbi:MAG TPA: PIN domain-containing protein [Patescibacteria group bacterium]|nr:PIN domain-containing protein [Patescibacteria group bacterium]
MTPKIFLDTNALIYLIENHPDFSPKISPIFNQIFQNQLQSITSIITVTEVLVNPMKQENKSLIEKYLNLFTNLTSLKVVEPNMQTAIDAAHIKAKYGFPLPDCYQLSLAQEHACTSFLTNDSRLEHFSQKLEIVTISKLKA